MLTREGAIRGEPYEFVPRWNVGGAFVGGGVHSGFMRIRTLAGPPLPHELVNDTCRAIILAHTAAITEAATVLQDRVDVLLDRLTDRVMSAPQPGTAQWLTEFRRPSLSPQERRAVRSAILVAAGFTSPSVRSAPGRRSRPVNPARLPMF